MRQIVGTQVFFFWQIFQCNAIRIILIDIVNNVADTLHDHRIIIFEIHDHTIFKRKQIKVLVQIFDDINHLINTGAFVVEISSGVIQQNMK